MAETVHITTLCKSRGIKPSLLASKLGVTRRKLWEWRVGVHKWPLDKALQTAQLLAVPVEQIEWVEPKVRDQREVPHDA